MPSYEIAWMEQNHDDDHIVSAAIPSTPKKVKSVKCVVCEVTKPRTSMNYILPADNPLILGVCAGCTKNTYKSKILYWCPECEDLYTPDPTWVSGNLGHYATAPCKKHSVSTQGPAAECVICNEKQSVYWLFCSRRAVWFCNLHWGETHLCSASYCKSNIHPNQDGVVETPAGTKLYCADCSKVRTNPEPEPANFHPLLWDYSSTCHCPTCVHLRGRDEQWAESDISVVADTPCDMCGTMVNFLTTEVAEDGSVYCHTCQTHLNVCSLCEELKPNGHFPTTAHSDADGVCTPCLKDSDQFYYCLGECESWYPDNHDCHCQGVKSYSYSPNIITFLHSSSERKPDPSSVPFIGLELEVEAQKDGASRAEGTKLVSKLFGDYCYTVHDGTLLNSPGKKGGKGFEIVTHPFTFSWFEERWPELHRLLDTLVDNGYRSWEGGRCGIHINLSRAPMSQSHQWRFINFFYGSTNLALCVGQRGYKAISKYAPFHAEPREYLMQKVRNFKNPGVPGNKHYCALSTNKKHVIEARWFRGTLNPMGLRKNIEFMYSTWLFTRAYGMTSANEYNYINWLAEDPQATRFATIRRFITDNYVTRR